MQVQGDKLLSWCGTYTERHTKSLQLPQIKNQDFTTENPFRFCSIRAGEMMRKITTVFKCDS